MIYCPSCGTANRHGSRYCNECGVKFSPQMEVKCPSCGELNAVHNPLCIACGQPLSSSPVPEKASFAETEAGAPDTAKEVVGIPGWWRDLPPPADEAVRPAWEDEGQSDLDRSSPPVSLRPARPRSPLLPQEGGREDSAEVPSAGGEAGQLPVSPEGSTRGMQGELPIAEFYSQPPAMPPGSTLRREQGTADLAIESPAAHLFGEIVTLSPRRATAVTARHKAPLLAQLPRWLLYAALIAAVTWPLVVQNPWSWLPGMAPGRYFGAARSVTAAPAVADLYRQIGSLGADTPVLVAFDYDPATAGEMDVVAGGLLEHLLDREVRLVTISLLPAGPATAQRLLETTMAGRPAYATGYGERCANLGYLPGKEAAVRVLGRRLVTVLPVDFFGNRLADLAVMDQITTLQSFDLIIALASGQDTLRWWIEQAGTPYQVKLGAGVSAALEPLARPYYETTPRQLVGLVGGVTGAAMYASLHQNATPAGAADEGSAGVSGLPLAQGMRARLDAQLAGHLVLILVILGGNVIWLVRAVMRRAFRRVR